MAVQGGGHGGGGAHLALPRLLHGAARPQQQPHRGQVAARRRHVERRAAVLVPRRRHLRVPRPEQQLHHRGVAVVGGLQPIPGQHGGT